MSDKHIPANKTIEEYEKHMNCDDKLRDGYCEKLKTENKSLKDSKAELLKTVLSLQKTIRKAEALKETVNTKCPMLGASGLRSVWGKSRNIRKRPNIRHSIFPDLILITFTI